MDTRYIILDFETSGLDPSGPERAEIIEVGALKVQGFEVVARFHALVKPERPVPEPIQRLTGLTADRLENERSLEEVAPELIEFLGDLPIVAHNSQLEQTFLDHFISPLRAGDQNGELYSTHNSIEPLALILADEPSHSMESLRRWAGIESEGAHRADKDCEDLLALLKHAFEYMKIERPHVAAIAQHFLEDEAWWWLSFFSDPDLPRVQPGALLPDREEHGDLRELRARDSDRTIDWEKKIGADPVHQALVSGAEGFQYREAQEKMAQLVRQSLENGEKLAVEAPTGTGKSIAYLLPGLLASRQTGAPLVVSTHSKSLQDQLLEKDLPAVRKILKDPNLRATTVKGQDNYLCLRKLHDLAASIGPAHTLDEKWSAAYLMSFAGSARVAELDRVSHYLKTRFPALAEMCGRVNSHHTTTVGPTCSFYKSCHYFDSARLAHEADVVIANHALVFQWPAQLPKIRNIVFDEAHHLEDQITRANSLELSESELAENTDRLSRKQGPRRIGDAVVIGRLLNPLTLPAPFDQDPPSTLLSHLTDQLRVRLLEVRNLVPLAMPPVREGSEGFEQNVELSKIRGAVREQVVSGLRNLAQAVGELHRFLAAGVTASQSIGSRGGVGQDPDFDVLSTQAFRYEGYSQKIQALLAEDNPNHLRLLLWDPRENLWSLSVQPISVAELSQPFFTDKRGVVLTSATLTSASSPNFVIDRIGLKLTQPLSALPSPYRLEEQAVILIPQDIPVPGTSGHLETLISFTEQVAGVLGGKTLLLMTSNRRLRQAAEILRERLRKQGITVLDSLSERRAAEVFRTSERALLIGSERYGEGLDIPGDALSCVIIEKINEAMTRSPLAEARKARTRFGLYDFDFPLRMMWLKQRVGRLIRSPSDRGAVVVFDSRYHGWAVNSRAHVDRSLAPIPVEGGRRDQLLERIAAIVGIPS